MPSLRELQLAFASSLFGMDADAMSGLVLEDGFSVAERMRVYRNNVRIGFSQALRATFPVVEELGGTEWFESVALRYQRQHPSRCGDLQFTGDRFAQFLRSDLSGTPYEWMVEVARLEWAYQEVLVAADSTPLDPSMLALLTPTQQEHVAFVPRSELRLIDSPVPLLEIWRAHRADGPMPDHVIGSASRAVLLLRRVDHVELREVPPATACLLQSFLEGATLAAAQQQLSALLPGAALGDALLHLQRLGALASIRVINH